MTASNVELMLPLVGAFQASNALVAAGLAMATGASAATRAADALPICAARAGRLELGRHVAQSARRSSSTTPTRPMRWRRCSTPCGPMCGGRLVVVFGCGGDRDKGKRPEMGAAAASKADRVIVTDDNPRSEDAGDDPPRHPGGCARRHEIGDRAERDRRGHRGA